MNAQADPPSSMPQISFSKVFFVIVALLITSVVIGFAQLRSLDDEGQLVEPKEPTKIDTTNWHVYESIAMGFSIKYPPEWEVSPELPYFGGTSVSFYPKSYDVELGIKKGASFYSDEDTLEESVGKPIGSEEQKLILDGYPATTITTIDHWARGGQDISATRVYEKEHEVLVSFLIYNYDENKGATYLPILNTILSSFRFN